MKKIFAVLAILAIGFGFSSCSEDEIQPQIEEPTELMTDDDNVEESGGVKGS